MVDNERGWDLKDRNGCGRNLFFLNLETLLEWEGIVRVRGESQKIDSNLDL